MKNTEFVLAAIRRYLDQKKVEYTCDGCKFCFTQTAAFSYLKFYTKTIYISDNGIAVFTTTPLKVDTDRIPLFCEAVCRMNFGYLSDQGHFEIDADDGELRHISVLSSNIEDIDHAINNALSCGTVLFLRYEEALLGIHNGLSPKDAVTKNCDAIYDNIKTQKALSKSLTADAEYGNSLFSYIKEQEDVYNGNMVQQTEQEISDILCTLQEIEQKINDL